MRTIKFAMVVVALIPTISSRAVAARWPYQKTDEVKITLVDDVTQKPVPGVLLEGVWTAEKLAAGFESRSKQLKRDRWISDESGQVTIPAFNSADIAVSLRALWIWGKHPLYPNIDIRLFDRDDKQHYTDIMNNEVTHSGDKVSVVAHITSLKSWSTRYKCTAKPSKGSIYKDGIDDSCRQSPLGSLTRAAEYFNDHRFADRIKALAPTHEECIKHWNEFIASAYKNSPLVPIVDPVFFEKESIAIYKANADLTGGATRK